MFDVRLHPAHLRDQDLETLHRFGVTRAVAVADASPKPEAAAILEHFDELLDVQLPRLEKAGIRARAALGVHPYAVPRRGLSHVLEALPARCTQGRVVAIGMVGLARGTDAEVEALREQLALAHRLSLPIFITTGAVDREKLTRRVLFELERFFETETPEPGRLSRDHVLLDGATGRTVRAIKALGFTAGLSLHPDALTVEKAVALVRALGPERLVLSTAAGDGAGDMLALARAEHRLVRAGLSRSVVARVTDRNAALLLNVA